MKRILLFVIMAIGVRSFSKAQPGKPDLSFGTGGRTITNFDRYDYGADHLSNVLIQPDGKVLYSGSIRDAAGFLFRFKAHAPSPYTLKDSTFGVNGDVFLPGIFVADVALQPDGKILVAGFTSDGLVDDIALVRLNSNGSLDLSFGDNGKVITRIGAAYNVATAMALQADGKIIVGGYTSGGSGTDFLLVRYHTNGSIDNSFDGDGKVMTHYGFLDVLTDIAIQPDGKIVAEGYTTLTLVPSANYDIALLRYNTDGSPDNGFGTTGKVITAVGAGAADDRGMNMVLQPDGKIVVTGYTHNGANNDFTLLRFNTNGTPDVSFSGDGKLTTAFGAGDDAAYALALQPDGKIIVAGSTFGGSDKEPAMARYTTTGDLDAGFDGDGKVSLSLLTDPTYIEDDVIYAIALQPDGKIVVAGSSLAYNNLDLLHARFLANGSLDASFPNGMSANGGTVDIVNAMAVQQDGKIVLAGTFGSTTTATGLAVARYKTNGSPDSSFATHGKAMHIVNALPLAVNAVAVQPDGRIIVAGGTRVGAYDDWLLVRLRANGTLDPDFDTDGVVVVGFGAKPDQVTALALQPDGKLVAAGFMTNASNQTDFVLARYNSHGSLDAGFGIGGQVITSVGSFDKLFAVVVQPDGKLLAAGYSAGKLALIRYMPDGNYDQSFGISGLVVLPVNTTMYATDLKLQPDGKILVAGYSYAGASTSSMFTLVRLRADGTPDDSFDTDGMVTASVGPTENQLKSVEVQKDNKIVVAGTAYTGTSGSIAVMRYLPDGKPDPGFDGDGKLLMHINGTSDVLGAMKLVDNRIYLAGSTVTENLNDFLLMALQNDNELRDIDTAVTVRLWPNPAHNILHVRIPAYGDGAIHLQMTDMAGRIMYRRSLAAGTTPVITTIPVAALQTGIYTLSVRTKKGREVLLFMKGGE
jgi:uncharacterized delta-60 repeat protein